jgi:hypothetical protein
MVKRFLAAVVLLAAAGCGDTAPPTSSRPEPRSAFDGGASAAPRSILRSVAPSAQAGAIEVIDPTTLVVTGSITFEDLGQASANYDAILDREGAAFAERFAGQDLSGEISDILSGTPTAPLSLQVGAPSQNVNTIFDPPSNATVVDGLGPSGFPNGGAIGEGAIAVLFDEDQAELGFSINGANAGTATASFFQRDGSLIETVVLQLTSAAVQPFAFRRAGASRDIAGVSIYNDDGGGIGYFAFRIDELGSTTQDVPADTPTNVTLTQNNKLVAGINLTLERDATVTVRFVDVGTGQCHDYLLGQVNRCLEITALDANNVPVPLTANATIAVCGDPDLELFKADNRTSRPIALQQTTPPFTLDCSEFASVAPKNWLEGLAMRIKRVGDWLGPKPLYAADRGFGGIIDIGISDHLSLYTWASPIQVSRASLAVNVLNRGKDVFGVRGTFNLGPKNFTPFETEAGFDPTTHEVIVGYGRQVFTIPVNSFRCSQLLQRCYYAAFVAGTGITAMEISKLDGTFTIAGITTTQGAADPASGLQTYRAFSLQIAHRSRGAGLECAVGTLPNCHLQHID